MGQIIGSCFMEPIMILMWMNLILLTIWL